MENTIDLHKSIENLKKCYSGIDKDLNHVLDKKKIDELTFLFSMNRVAVALRDGEITEKKFIKKISKNYDYEQ